MKIRAIHIVLGIILFYAKAHAQEPSDFSKDRVLECIAESYTGDTEDDADLSDILEELEHYMESPMNLNTATRDDLEKLLILNDYQIENLLAYRDKMGQLFSPQELLNVDGFNEKVVDDLTLFIIFSPPEIVGNYFKNEVNLRSQYVFEKANGFIENEDSVRKFAGIEPKLYLKYHADKSGKFEWGVTAENDAGEEFFSGSNPAGFDFYSGFLGWKGTKTLRKIYLGDFQVKTGQGLIFWSGYGGRKTAEATSIHFSGQGIRPYASTSEYGFFRGTAIQFKFNQIDLIAFYSNKNCDANISEYDENNSPSAVSSLQTSGYHRTESEIADKKSLNAQTTGMTAKYTKNRFTAGINGGFQHFSLPIEPTPKLYNQFYFSGKTNYNLSTDYLLILNNIHLFGEVAVSKSGGLAFTSGIEASPSDELSFNLLYRNYQKDFHSINGSSFSEFGSVSNERGLYASLTCYAIPKVTINSYLDLYESHWVKYTSLAPIKGADFLIETDFSLSKKITLSLRYRTETRNQNSANSSIIKKDETNQTNRVRLNVEWNASENFNFRFRTEWSGMKESDSLDQGWLVLTDASFHTSNDRFAATARLAWFDTKDYNSRIYAYENDVPSSFYIPSYYLNGLRYYVNLRLKSSRKISFYFKLSQTRYLNNTKSIGSGYSQIDKNHKTEIKLQVRFQF